ncbi:PE-PGRS family protein [Streptomyces albidoflavus]|uniref:PE-PGRS family protein n=1 Tax=Streptomyces albidoflavus TaxID=1886 RepID=UPI00101ED040|nr:PE-PGRS family protein [Streptomyces albidoflavus]RZE74899.1 PE-PGRS family protein [Streptomyces albidoflavus]
MRTVNAQDLEQLAKLLDGRGGLQDKLDEAFTRASSLGVTSKLTTLHPLRSWATDTAPDLRKRATFARLEDGDPEAGLRWAGFTDKELARLRKGEGLTPDEILLANSVAASEDPDAFQFQREPNESLNKWLDRLKVHAIAQLPGLAPHEATVGTLYDAASNAHAIMSAGTRVVMQGSSLTTVLVGNSLKNGRGAVWKNRVAGALQRSRSPFIRQRGVSLARWSPPIRSLSAPGTWLPGRLGAMFQGNRLYQTLTRVPFTAGWRADLLGRGYDHLRSAPAVRSIGVNRTISRLVGNDKFAARFGGLTHSGQEVKRAANANLARVGQRLFNFRGGMANPGKSLRFAVAGTVKTAGFFRTTNVVGNALSTGVSVANVVSHGNPVNAFKEKGAEYVADVAEVGFNASLTAATVAPNPVTIGLVVGTGLIYGGAKVVENWDDIKKGAGKAVDWAKDTGGKVLDGAKDLAKKADPRNWF